MMEKAKQSPTCCFQVDHEPAGHVRRARGQPDLGLVFHVNQTKHPPLTLILEIRCAMHNKTRHRASHRLEQRLIALNEESSCLRAVLR
ncbi:hypothetical protein QF036_002694 [Arthrobacter globiformis]|nr:hypothetical protein [Arthrobacter globiformis]